MDGGAESSELAAERGRQRGGFTTEIHPPEAGKQRSLRRYTVRPGNAPKKVSGQELGVKDRRCGGPIGGLQNRT